jgi:hypothetical protein
MNATTGVHSRATCRLQIPAVCAVFVPRRPRACPRFRPRNLNGKEGVDGSSPSEGFGKGAGNGAFLLTVMATTQGGSGLSVNANVKSQMESGGSAISASSDSLLEL